MVSTIILAYNRCSEVLVTIDKMKTLSASLPFEMEIIVVDNGSVDDTSEQVRRKHNDVILVRKKENNGIAGWNEGFKIARHKYFLVLDDDSHVESGLAEAVDHLERNSYIGILALNVTTGPYVSADCGWKNGGEILGFFGCGALIRKEVYDKIGGFAEWLHVYAHEWEYGIRVLDAGYKNIYFEKCIIIHRASATNRSFERLRVFSTRNEYGIIYKYYGNDRWKYIIRMFINNLKYIKGGEYRKMYLDIKGFFEFMKIRKTLTHTPVKKEVQDYFTEKHWNLFPAFGFIERKLSAGKK
jgi:GT2 family glycosyltransferase